MRANPLLPEDFLVFFSYQLHVPVVSLKQSSLKIQGREVGTERDLLPFLGTEKRGSCSAWELSAAELGVWAKGLGIFFPLLLPTYLPGSETLGTEVSRRKGPAVVVGRCCRFAPAQVAISGF